MRLVVVDTSTMLSAILSPGGRRRKMLVLLAYGRVASYERFGPGEQKLLDDERARVRGISGSRRIDEFVERAAHARAVLAEKLPVTAPDDLGLVISRPLLDEYENRLAAKGPLISRSFVGGDEEVMRLQIAHFASHFVKDFDPSTIPAYTEGRDRKDDPIIHTAIAGNASAVVADDKKHIAITTEGPTTYKNLALAQEVDAYRFEDFVYEQIDTSNFDLDEVDGSLLAEAARHLT